MIVARSSVRSFLAAACLAAPLLAQDHAGHMAPPAAPDPAGPVLLGNLGTWHRAVTATPEAQRWFDQGLALLYSFNLEEAQRSFEQGARLDPRCVACWWGVGMSLGPHLNLPGLPDRTVAGHAAVAKAKALLAAGAAATPVERDLVAALDHRFTDPAPADPAGQHAIDAAYADAMVELAKRWPDDLDVAALAVEARMDLRPWDLWAPDGTPQPGTEAIVADLEAILALAPNHPGANHYYVHALEASPHPEKALEAAARLPSLVPGAAHIVHMPAHIYQRVGRYEDASEANRRAVAVDTAYLAKVPPLGFYLMYTAHNHQFLWASALMEGRGAESLRAARDTLAAVPIEMFRQMPGMDMALGYPIWTLVRFGRFAEAVAEPAPPAEFAFATAGFHAARGIALARLGRLDEARAEAASAATAAAAIPADAREGLSPARSLATVAQEQLAGEIALAAQDRDAAVAHLRAAVAAEDGLPYNEPRDWYFPVRPTLGAALLAAGRADEARAVFEEDLARNPENGWALAGLAAAQEKAGDAAAARATRARLAKAWARADGAIRPEAL